VRDSSWAVATRRESGIPVAAAAHANAERKRAGTGQAKPGVGVEARRTGAFALELSTRVDSALRLPRPLRRAGSLRRRSARLRERAKLQLGELGPGKIGGQKAGSLPRPRND
jgi:hypothetical protein